MRLVTRLGNVEKGDVVQYQLDNGRILTGTVVGVEVRRSYRIIPEGTLGIVDTVDD